MQGYATDGSIDSSTKIDAKAVDGLLGTPDSLAYKVDEVESHLHGEEKVYGAGADGFMLELEPVKWTVTGGGNAWGAELMISQGTEIEGGSAVKKYDMNHLHVVSVSVANKISAIQFLKSPIGTPVACAFDFTGGTVEDMVVAVGHGLLDGDKIVLKAGGGALPAELTGYTVYYVVNKANDYFQVSLTSGGAAVAFTDDGGACFFYEVGTSQVTATAQWVSMPAVNADSHPYLCGMERVPCNYRLFCRVKSETGAAVGIGFLVSLHTYAA